MTRPETLNSCAPSNNPGTILNSNPQTSRNSRFRILVFTALIPIYLLFSSSSAFAESRTKRSSAKASERRGVAGKRTGANKSKVSDKRRVASRRNVADTKRSGVKLTSKSSNRRARGQVAFRVTPKNSRTRETANRRLDDSSVRSTVIVTPKQATNQTATRPTLVNDIVIISESRMIPTPGTGSSGNMPSIWPVAGAIRGGFGVRRNPFGGSSSEFHKGQDISATYGAPVIATADGVVVLAGWLRGYGQVVYVDHGNGISTRYGHLSRIDATIGQVIRRGDQVGLVGSTGRSTGPHLHYEVRIDGQATNPVPYLPTIPLPPVSKSPAIR